MVQENYMSVINMEEAGDAIHKNKTDQNQTDRFSQILYIIQEVTPDVVLVH